MALIKCIECAGKVSSTASQCPHCGIEINAEEHLKSNEANSNKSNQRIIKFAIVLGGLGLISAMFAPPQEKKCDNIKAYVFLETVGAERFKSPSTVKFAKYPYANIVSSDCKTYNIRTYADAQNSYGGTVRSNITATVKLSNSTGQIIKFNISE